MNKLLAGLAFISCLPAHLPAQEIAGKWQIHLDSPHGPLEGTLDLQQDGAKFKGNCKVPIGDFPVTGTLDGKKIDMKLELPDGSGFFGLTGALDGDKMSGKTEMGGDWSASRAASAKAIRGTITSFHVASLEFGIQPDTGDSIRVSIGPETEVVSIAPGETDLRQAKPFKATDLALGDRVLVSFVEGLADARRIVVVNADAIVRRNEREKADWQQRGFSGVVAAANLEEITLEIRQPGSIETVVLAITSKTRVRRYAPGSVKFTEAQPADASAIRIGDQVRARGDKSPAGPRILADDIVFGSFVTRVGSVTAVDPAAHTIAIRDIQNQQPLTVHITADSQLRMMPDMRTMFAHHGASPETHAPPEAHGPFDIRQQILSMPAAALEDVKTGSSIVVTSTKGASPGDLTAILLLANAGALIQLAQSQAGSGDPLEAISKMHGGILAGPGGFNLPTILQ
jgi:hypothetical protein